MHRCPKCESEDIHRSRSKSKWEDWRKQVTLKRPFRCHACGWRGWGVDTGPKFRDEELKLAMRALAPDAANLRDASVEHDEPWPEDLGLETLDPSTAGKPKGNERATVHGSQPRRRVRKIAAVGPRS